MANYVSKHLLHSSSSSSNGNQTTSNRSSSSSASSTTSSTYPKKPITANIIDPAYKCTSTNSCHSTDDFMIKKFFSKIKLNRSSKAHHASSGQHDYEDCEFDANKQCDKHEKHVNIYEVPSNTTSCVINSKRHVGNRESQPHSPTTSTSNATSSSLNGSHSPPISTSNATATTQMHNDTLSSSSGAMEDTEGFYTSNMDLSAAASHDTDVVNSGRQASKQPLSFLKRNYKNLSSSWFSKSSSKSASSTNRGQSKDETAVTQNLLTTVKPSELI